MTGDVTLAQSTKYDPDSLSFSGVFVEYKLKCVGYCILPVYNHPKVLYPHLLTGRWIPTVQQRDQR